MKTSTFARVVLAGLLATTGLAGAADRDQDRTRDQDRIRDMTQQSEPARERVQAEERVYGFQLMTEQERNEHRMRMRNARTEQEREQIRAEHHERMKVRAKERGVTLPDEPLPRGTGRGMGGGPGR